MAEDVDFIVVAGKAILPFSIGMSIPSILQFALGWKIDGFRIDSSLNTIEITFSKKDEKRNTFILRD